VNLDWHRLKAVVIESDDWGLCAWVPDDQAHRVLAGQPAFRSEAGQRYGRSTLESARDVDRLAATLLEFRGGDGLPPVWQANTIVASPDWARLTPPLFEVGDLPLTGLGEATGRWERPGLLAAVRRACDQGAWWPELHGLHHLPAGAWLAALRRGQHDARAAHEQQSPVCVAVEAGGEYDAAETHETRARDLREAVARFEKLFGRRPESFCPPDYRFDDWLESEAGRLGLTTLQGKPEQGGGRLIGVRRRLLQLRFPHTAGARFYLPPRIAFEPRGEAGPAGRLGATAVHRAVRAAWGRGQPAIVSTHRLNYAHLDEPWSEAGRAALRDLLGSLTADGAVFLTDAEVRSLAERGWSLRPLGRRGALLRHYGVPLEPLRFAAPPGATAANLRAPGAGADGGEGGVKVADGTAEARVQLGEHVIEWAGT
jgi:hypothetical protein